MIWHKGQNPRVVRVGQGNIAERLACHKQDTSITAYSPYGLYVTWAEVPAGYLDGVERHLAESWTPLVGDRFPNVHPIAVNSPW